MPITLVLSERRWTLSLSFQAQREILLIFIMNLSWGSGSPELLICLFAIADL
jgi:hypothetical protein